MPEATYAPPVDQLLRLGEEPSIRGQWRDYAVLGLEPEHVPELIRMAVDHELAEAEGRGPETWAPIHAWRALGELRAEAAVAPLLGQLNYWDEMFWDWPMEEMPEVMARIGAPAVGPLREFLSDRNNKIWARMVAANGLAEIARRWPALRAACVEGIVEELEKPAEEFDEVKGALVADLLELKEEAAAPAIKRAYAAKMVGLDLCGDWYKVREELGISDERDRSDPVLGAIAAPPRHEPWGRRSPAAKAVRSFLSGMVENDPGSVAARKAERVEKARKKQAKKSRKRNRGR